jgi:hypothetical protein
MGKRGQGYGSEDHFRRYCGDPELAQTLERAVLDACGSSPGRRLKWVYPAGPTAREPRGLDFLTGRDDVQKRWRDFWPQRGTPPTWDGVAQIFTDGLEPEWVLIEAKANHPEFCSPPCQASVNGGRPQIEHALNKVKRHLGVHRHFAWLGTYYQHANRLAVLYFLHEAKVAARFVDVFITGDTFPDQCPCPQSHRDWEDLIEARRLTLGLPVQHPLSERISQLFLPALRTNVSASVEDAGRVEVLGVRKEMPSC